METPYVVATLRSVHNIARICSTILCETFDFLQEHPQGRENDLNIFTDSGGWTYPWVQERKKNNR